MRGMGVFVFVMNTLRFDYWKGGGRREGGREGSRWLWFVLVFSEATREFFLFFCALHLIFPPRCVCGV